MSDKCKICGELKSCIETWNYNFCEEFIGTRLLVFTEQHSGILFQKLISRIEKLELKLEYFDFANSDLTKRLEKLEQEYKDLNESYMGLAAENRHILKKLEQKESEL